MHSLTLFLSILSLAAQVWSADNSSLLPVHIITRAAGSFENLAVRHDGQILTTISYPSASIFQVDPLGILPMTLVYNMTYSRSANGIAERDRDVFYVASGSTKVLAPIVLFPESYHITEIDMRNVSVLPGGILSKKPSTRIVANLTNAGLPNGVAFSRPHSEHLLVADSYRGLIWNVNIISGEIGVTLNDTSTQGFPNPGSYSAGINGLKVHDGVMYWTNTNRTEFWKVEVDECGHIPAGHAPILITKDISCDDLVLDSKGNAYIAGPTNIITKVTPDGKQEIIAGTANSNTSTVVGPTALRFGRLVSDKFSLYVTTDGGLRTFVPGTSGLSRIDLGECA